MPETTTDRGAVKETWSVFPQKQRLTVTLELEPKGPMPAVSVARVYDRVEEPE